MSNAAEITPDSTKSAHAVITQIAVATGVALSFADDPNPDAALVPFTLEVLGAFEDWAPFDIAESIQQAAFIIANQERASVDSIALRHLINAYKFDGLDERNLTLVSSAIDVTDGDGTFSWNRRFDMPFARIRQGNFRELEASPNMLSTELNVVSGCGKVRWYQREALKFFTNKTPVLKGLHSRCKITISGTAIFVPKEERVYLRDYLGAAEPSQAKRYYYDFAVVQQIGTSKQLLTVNAPVNLFDPEGNQMVEGLRAQDAWKVAKHLNRNLSENTLA